MLRTLESFQSLLISSVNLQDHALHRFLFLFACHSQLSLQKFSWHPQTLVLVSILHWWYSNEAFLIQLEWTNSYFDNSEIYLGRQHQFSSYKLTSFYGRPLVSSLQSLVKYFDFFTQKKSYLIEYSLMAPSSKLGQIVNHCVYSSSFKLNYKLSS